MLNFFTFIDEELTKLKCGENEVFKGKIDKDITVVLDVGDVGDVPGLGGGVLDDNELLITKISMNHR